MQHSNILKKEVNDLASVYLLYGEEQYLIEEFLNEFIDSFVAKELKDFNFSVLEENEELIKQLSNAVQTLPFMTEKRIVIVHCYDLFAKKIKNEDRINDLLDDFPKTTILVFVCHKKPDKRLKLFKKVKKVGEALQFTALKYKKLDQWLEKKAGSYDYEIDKMAIRLLEEAFNNDLKRLERELDKVITYTGEKKRITKSDVEAIISKDWLAKDNIIFDFVDAIGKKKISLALKLLSDIIEDGSEAKQILGMIARQVRLMLQTKILSQNGLAVEQIAKRLNQHPYPIKKCLAQSSNFTIESLERALERLLETDFKLVTGGDQKLELELLVIDLKETI